MSPRVYRSLWAVPVAAPPIRDAAVRVDEHGRIEAVSRADTVDGRGAEVVDLGAAILLPGLVNVHAHPELTLLRGRLDGLAFPDWIESLVRLKYRRLERADFRDSTQLGVAEAIASGVTCLAAPDDAGFLLGAMLRAGLRGRVYREAFGPDPSDARGPLRKLQKKVKRMRRQASGSVDVGISPHAPYTVSEPLLRQLAEFACVEELPVCMHVAESEAEDRYLRQGSGPFAERLRRRGIQVAATGRSPVEWLAESGALETRPLLVHCVRVDGADIRRIADSGASIAHCPISNAKLGHGLAPLAAFLESGIPTGLGSDSVASNDRIDILEEARFTMLAHRARARDPVRPDPETVLRLATIEGARALGLGDRIGTLEPGKDADLTAIRCDGPGARPLGDPIDALVHSLRSAQVCLTVVAGRVLYRDGEFVTLDADELRRQADRLARRLNEVLPSEV